MYVFQALIPFENGTNLLSSKNFKSFTTNYYDCSWYILWFPCAFTWWPWCYSYQMNTTTTTNISWMWTIGSISSERWVIHVIHTTKMNHIGHITHPIHMNHMTLWCHLVCLVENLIHCFEWCLCYMFNVLFQYESYQFYLI